MYKVNIILSLFLFINCLSYRLLIREYSKENIFNKSVVGNQIPSQGKTSKNLDIKNLSDFCGYHTLVEVLYRNSFPIQVVCEKRLDAEVQTFIEEDLKILQMNNIDESTKIIIIVKMFNSELSIEQISQLTNLSSSDIISKLRQIGY